MHGKVFGLKWCAARKWVWNKNSNKWECKHHRGCDESIKKRMDRFAIVAASFWWIAHAVGGATTSPDQLAAQPNQRLYLLLLKD